MMTKSFLRRSTKRVVPGRVLDSVVRPAVRGVLSAAFGERGYKISIGGQGVFRLSPDFVFRGWEDFGTRHNSGFAQCIEACKGKSVFIDVGAHIGLYSLPASTSLRPGGRVIAFEPSEGNYRYLLKHIAYNGIDNIQAHQLVVGDVDRTRWYSTSMSWPVARWEALSRERRSSPTGSTRLVGGRSASTTSVPRVTWHQTS